VSAIYKLDPGTSTHSAWGVLKEANIPTPLLFPGKLPPMVVITPEGVILRIECKETIYTFESTGLYLTSLGEAKPPRGLLYVTGVFELLLPGTSSAKDTKFDEAVPSKGI
jgi:hypothetical protein